MIKSLRNIEESFCELRTDQLIMDPSEVCEKHGFSEDTIVIAD